MRWSAALAPRSAADALLVSTCATGLLVAVAPMVPSSLRLPLLFVALLAWTTVAAVAAVAVVGRWWVSIRRSDGPPRWASTIGVAGTAIAAVHLSLLGILRLVLDRPALTFNVDWRYHLNLSQGIARSGGLEEALDYQGAAIDYHVGPAWLAAATDDVLGGGIETVSFLVVPAVTTVVIAVACHSLLRTLGFSPAAGLVAPALLLVLPALDRSVVEYLAEMPTSVTEPNRFLFGTETSLNQSFAFAVGLAGLALVLRSGRAERVAGVLGLASTAVLKPQALLGFGSMLAAITLVALLAGTDRVAPERRRSLVAVTAATGLVGVALALAQPLTSIFGPPRLRFLDTGAPPQELDGWIVVGIVAIAAGLAARRREPGSETIDLSGHVVAGAGAYTCTWLFLNIVQFPLGDEASSRAEAVGLNGSADYAQPDIAQALIYSGGVIGLLAMATIVHHGIRLFDRGALVIAAVAFAAVLAPLPLVALTSADVERGLEYAEDTALRDLLARIPGDGLAISSDIADPDDDHERAALGMLLTGYRGTPFWLSNLAYLNFREADAADRLAQLRHFYGTPWSPWHTDFLSRNRITHVLVNERCPATWQPTDDPAVALDIVAAAGEWTLYSRRVIDAAPSDSATTPPPTSTGPEARRGGPCLGAA